MLLAAAAAVTAPGGELLIGVTGESMLAKKAAPELLQPYAARGAAAAEYAAAVRPGLNVRVSELVAGQLPAAATLPRVQVRARGVGPSSLVVRTNVCIVHPALLRSHACVH